MVSTGTLRPPAKRAARASDIAEDLDAAFDKALEPSDIAADDDDADVADADVDAGTDIDAYDSVHVGVDGDASVDGRASVDDADDADADGDSDADAGVDGDADAGVDGADADVGFDADAGAGVVDAEVARRPIAPAARATLIGRASDPRLPAKPREKSPGKSSLPGVSLPRPAPKGKSAPLDPTKQRAMLDAVLADPDDDAPRRAYADWLEAHGDPRGELIRVSLDPAGADAERFAELHQRNATKWTKSLKALGKMARWRWDRGFVHELRVTGWDAGCTPENLAAVLASEPIVELAIDGGDAEVLARLLAVPGIERVKRLAISGWNPDDGGAFVGRVLAGASRIGAVTELRVGVKLGDAGIESLLRAALRSTVHLAVGGGDVSIATFAKLASSSLGQQLEVLEWLRDPIPKEMAALIVTMPCLHTFVASWGCADTCKGALTKRFRNRFIEESERGMQYLIDGVRGVSYRAQPKR